MNTELNNPSGTMSWIGETKNVIFNFRIERTRPDGTVVHDPVVIGTEAPGKLKILASAVVVKGQAPVPGIPKEGANVSV